MARERHWALGIGHWALGIGQSTRGSRRRIARADQPALCRAVRQHPHSISAAADTALTDGHHPCLMTHMPTFEILRSSSFPWCSESRRGRTDWPRWLYRPPRWHSPWSQGHRQNIIQSPPAQRGPATTEQRRSPSLSSTMRGEIPGKAPELPYQMMVHVAPYAQNRVSEALMYEFDAHMIGRDEIIP